jgi:cysteine desulfurase / selenocysteine lyase
MSTLIDVTVARAGTPGISNTAFLTSAGSSLPTSVTLQTVIDHLHREATIGGYLAADEVAERLIQARSDLGVLVGGMTDEVCLASSDTAAWIKAWWGWVLGGNIPAGSTVLVDQLAYHSHHSALVQTQGLANYRIEVMPSLPDGTTDVASVTIGPDVAVLCVTMIGTHCGNVNPVAELGALATRAGVPMFVDGCQALGQLALDVRAMGASVFTGTGRKWLRGPRGTGMLWVAAKLIERFSPPGLDGTNSDWSVTGGVTVKPGISRFSEFETNVAAYLGLGAAAAQAVALGMPAVEARVTSLADQLRSSLRSIEGVTVHDTAIRRCGIVTFSVAGALPESVVSAGAAAQVAINTSSANWATLDMQAKGLQTVVRASPHYFNTESEIDRLVTVVSDLSR